MTAPRVGNAVDTLRLVAAWLNDTIGDAHASTRLPASITGRTLWVADAGSTPAYDNLLHRVDVASMVPGGYGAAWTLATDAHDAMRALDGQTVDGQPVSTVSVWSEPTYRFWTDTVDRVVGTYLLDLPVLL